MIFCCRLGHVVGTLYTHWPIVVFTPTLFAFGIHFLPCASISTFVKYSSLRNPLHVVTFRCRAVSELLSKNDKLGPRFGTVKTKWVILHSKTRATLALNLCNQPPVLLQGTYICRGCTKTHGWHLWQDTQPVHTQWCKHLESVTTLSLYNL